MLFLLPGHIAVILSVRNTKITKHNTRRDDIVNTQNLPLLSPNENQRDLVMHKQSLQPDIKFWTILKVMVKNLFSCAFEFI